MIRSVALASVFALAGQGALADVTRDCGTFEANARNLVLPPEIGIRTFAEGAIRMFYLDTGGEPACCSSHLMVVLPSPEDPGDICTLISNERNFGYGGLDLAGAVASYDAATGLSVDVPVRVFDGADFVDETLTVTINQQSGVVATSQR